MAVGKSLPTACDARAGLVPVSSGFLRLKASLIPKKEAHLFRAKRPTLLYKRRSKPLKSG